LLQALDYSPKHMAIQTNIERCITQLKCERCTRQAEFILKSDDLKEPLQGGARELLLCRVDLTNHLAKNPGLMAQVLMSLIEQRL
jgi:hypothetical protein